MNIITNLFTKIKTARQNATIKLQQRRERKKFTIEYQKAIIAEFNLIQEKKSTLSASGRKKIEGQVSYMILNRIIRVEV